MPDHTSPSPESLALNFKRYIARYAVDEGLFLDMDASVQHDVAFDHLVLQLRAKVLSDDLPPEHFTARRSVVHQVPAGTWQTWKARHARRWYASWLVRRRPVRYEPDPDGRSTELTCTFDLERYRLYPHARVVPPPNTFGPAVLVHEIRNLDWTGDADHA